MFKSWAQRLSHWGNVPVIAPTGGIQIGSLMIWVPILALILRDLGASDFHVSIAVALWTTGEALAQYLGGFLADRIGRRPVITYTSYLAAVFLLAGALASHWVFFALAYIGFRSCKGLQTPVFPAIIGESVSPRLRGRAFGVVEMFIASFGVVGPLLGAQLIPVWGAQRLIYITAGSWVLSGMIRQRFLRETLVVSESDPKFSFRMLLVQPLRDVTLVMLALLSMFNITLWGPFMALHANDVLLLTRTQITLFYALGSLCGAISSPFIGRLVDQMGLSRVLGFTAVVFGFTVLFWSFQSAVSWIILGYIIMGIAFQACMISLSAYRMAAVLDGMRGVGLGACGMVSMLGSAMLLPLVGYFRALWGPYVPFIMAALCGIWIAQRLMRSPSIPQSAPSESHHRVS